MPGPRPEPKLQPGPAEDTRLFFDALREEQEHGAAWIAVFTVARPRYTHVNRKKKGEKKRVFRRGENRRKLPGGVCSFGRHCCFIFINDLPKHLPEPHQD